MSSMSMSGSLRDLFYAVGFKVDDKGLKDADKSIEKLDKKTKSFGDTLDSIGKKAQGVSGSLTKFSVPAAALIGASSKVFMNYDDSIRKVWATTGATEEEFKKLDSTARNLGKNSSAFKEKDVAEAMNFLALAGWDTNQIIGATPGVMNLATAAGTDLATTSDILSDNMTVFKLRASDANKVADMFAQTQRKSNTSVLQLGEAYKNVGGSASAAGMDMAQTNAILGIFANQGLKGSVGGTTLNNMFTDLKKNAGAAGMAVGNTNVAVYDSLGNMRDMGSIMQDLEKSTKGMTSAQRDAILMQYFGKQAMRGVNASLIAGSDAYKTLHTEIVNSSGAAAEMTEIMEGGAGGAFRRIGSALSTILVELGSTFEAPLEKISQWAKNVAIAFVNLPASVKKGISGTLLAIAGAKPLAMGVGYMSGGAAQILTWLVAIKLAFSRTFDAIGLGIASMSSKIGASIVSVFETAYIKMLYAIGAMKSALAKFYHWLITSLIVMSPTIIPTSFANWNVAPQLTFFQKIRYGIANTFLNLFKWISRTLAPFLSVWRAALTLTFQAPLATIGAKLSFGPALGQLKAIGAVIAKFKLFAIVIAIGAIILGIAKLIKHWDTVKEKVTGVAAGIKAVFKPMFDYMINALKWLGSRLMETFSKVTEVLKELGMAIGNTLVALWPLFKYILIGIGAIVVALGVLAIVTIIVIAHILNFALKIVNAILDIFLILVKRLGEMLEEVGLLIGGWVEDFKTIFGGITDFLIGAFTGDWDRAWNGILDITLGIVNIIIGAIEGMINVLVSGLNAIIDTGNLLSDWIPGIEGNMPTIKWKADWKIQKDNNPAFGMPAEYSFQERQRGKDNVTEDTVSFWDKFKNELKFGSDSTKSWWTELFKDKAPEASKGEVEVDGYLKAIMDSLGDLGDGVGGVNNSVNGVGNGVDTLNNTIAEGGIRARRPYEFTQLDEERRVVYVDANRPGATYSPEGDSIKTIGTPGGEQLIINNEFKFDISGDGLDIDKLEAQIKTIVGENLIPALEEFFSNLRKKRPSLAA